MINRFAAMAVVLLTITSALWAQDRQVRHNPLQGLKGGLKTAGAPELTAEQEEQLRALLTDFREITRDARPGTEVREARQAYLDAVLDSDGAAANLQAEIIAGHTAAITVTKLENRASLKIQFLNILTQDQVDAVLEHNGTAGLFRLLGTSGPGRQQGHRPHPSFRR